MTCTVFHSVSIACYCVQCSRGVVYLDYSLPFVCLLTEIGNRVFQMLALAKKQLEMKNKGD